MESFQELQGNAKDLRKYDYFEVDAFIKEDIKCQQEIIRKRNELRKLQDRHAELSEKKRKLEADLRSDSEALMRFCNCENIQAKDMQIPQLKAMVDTKFTGQLQNLEQYYTHSTTTRLKPGAAAVFDQFRDHAVEVFQKQCILVPN